MKKYEIHTIILIESGISNTIVLSYTSSNMRDKVFMELIAQERKQSNNRCWENVIKEGELCSETYRLGGGKDFLTIKIVDK